jgi:hypothetical protein
VTGQPSPYSDGRDANGELPGWDSGPVDELHRKIAALEARAARWKAAAKYHSADADHQSMRRWANHAGLKAMQERADRAEAKAARLQQLIELFGDSQLQQEARA